MRLNILHVLGMSLTLIFISIVSFRSGKKIKNANDFSTGDKNLGSILVAGIIMGTLVGGSSTIATAQLAFEYGFTAIWFNLGAGLGCMVLSLVFIKKFRNSQAVTIQEIIEKEYGQLAGTFSSVFCSIGIFLSVVAQLFSSIALLNGVLPITPLVSALISVFLMASYIIFGGIKGAGIVGIIKTSFIYISLIICTIIILKMVGGIAPLKETLPNRQYFNLFARGLGTDGGAALSLILGVLCTQTYVQSVISSKDYRSAVAGGIISAVLIPPIGLGGVFIGMYMKIQFPTMDSSLVFPRFILNVMPDFIGGIILATLLIVTIGSGAGLTLGISSIFSNNIVKKLYPNLTEKRQLFITRGIIFTILFIALIFTFGNMKTLILQWSFMSMGLRAAVLFFPMCSALFMPKKIEPKFIVASIFLGPLFVLLGKITFKFSFDPLFLGLFVSFIIILTGYFYKTLKNK